MDTNGYKCPRCDKRYSPEYERTYCMPPCFEPLVPVAQRLTKNLWNGKPNGRTTADYEKERYSKNKRNKVRRKREADRKAKAAG